MTATFPPATSPSPAEARQLAEAQEILTSEGSPIPRLLVAPAVARETIASPRAYRAVAAAKTIDWRRFPGMPSVKIRRRLRRTVER